MKNKDVYKLTDEIPITLDILKRRWRLFGHILRLHENTPAKKSMYHYFSPSSETKYRGRTRQTLPKTLSDDIVRTVKEDPEFNVKYSIAGLKTLQHLETLMDMAYNRKRWLSLTTDIYKVAEAVMRPMFQQEAFIAKGNNIYECCLFSPVCNK